MFLLVDNYDSFTYNLWHFLGELGAEFEVRRNDKVTVDEILAMDPQGVVISPGPCDPDQAGICLELVERAAGRIPMFGVCLGHQAIGQVFGAKVVRANEPMHGKLSKVSHDDVGLFEGLPNNFEATRYHSLTLDPESIPDILQVTARTEDGVIMGLQHRELEIHGAQFHPESIASECGYRLLTNFLKRAGHNEAPTRPIEELERRLKQSDVRRTGT